MAWRNRTSATLYLIEFLHQTTTETRRLFFVGCCILLNFYIKPQQDAVAGSRVSGCILLNFYIKPQPRRARRWRSTGCILLNFYIKPQPGVTNGGIRSVVSYWISTSNHNNDITAVDVSELYLIEFLHQTTTSVLLVWLVFCCILLNFYIKPQGSFRAFVSTLRCILLNFYIKPQHRAVRV